MSEFIYHQEVFLMTASIKRPTIAIIGASADRHKFGNRAVRAYKLQGYEVFPINPKEKLIEGLPVYSSILDVPRDQFDIVSLYVPPEIGAKVLPDVARKKVGELWLNPGSDSPELIDQARALGLKVVVACSILNVGMNPHEMA